MKNQVVVPSRNKVEAKTGSGSAVAKKTAPADAAAESVVALPKKEKSRKADKTKAAKGGTDMAAKGEKSPKAAKREKAKDAKGEKTKAAKSEKTKALKDSAKDATEAKAKMDPTDTKGAKDDKSTKFLVSMKKSLRKALKKEAAEMGITMNDFIVAAVEARLDLSAGQSERT